MPVYPGAHNVLYHSLSSVRMTARKIKPASSTSEAWEACYLLQKTLDLAAFSQFLKRLNWKILENEG
jgi:hypothetical protein